jgi:hypothetical protein
VTTACYIAERRRLFGGIASGAKVVEEAEAEGEADFGGEVVVEVVAKPSISDMATKAPAHCDCDGEEAGFFAEGEPILVGGGELLLL